MRENPPSTEQDDEDEAAAAAAMAPWITMLKAFVVVTGIALVLTFALFVYLFIDKRNEEQATERAVEVVCEWLPERFGLDPRAEVQTLAPMKRGSCGVHALNRALQERLNPDAPGRPSLSRMGQRFAEGDRVMQMANNYKLDVMNGE
ncbi:MAG: hypothetical protein ACLFTL_07115, partial [Alphaproteobacteria bacterium]